MTVSYSVVETENKSICLSSLINDDGTHSFPVLRFNLSCGDYFELFGSQIYELFDNLRHLCLDGALILDIQDKLKLLENKTDNDLLQLQNILFTGFKFGLFVDNISQ